MWLNQVAYRLYCLHFKVVLFQEFIKVFKLSVSLLVPSDFERKKIGEINSPFSCSVYSIIPLPERLPITWGFLLEV